MKRIFFFIITAIVLTSCSKLNTDSVTYQSVRKVYQYNLSDNSVIHVTTDISKQGYIYIGVENLSTEVMTINMTKSFIVTPNGKSHSMYDPTVRVNTSTVSKSESTSKGRSVNWGAVAGAVGVGGTVGQVLSGINTGSSNTNGVTTTKTETTYFSDLPELSIAPRGSGILPKEWEVVSMPMYSSGVQNDNFTFETSTSKFSVCLLYSIDYGKTWRKYEQWYYINSVITEKVNTRGAVNDAVRRILLKKRDAINEPWWAMHLRYKDDYSAISHEASVCNGIFEDYQ